MTTGLENADNDDTISSTGIEDAIQDTPVVPLDSEHTPQLDISQLINLHYSENTLTFLDTNILLPSEQWSFYKNCLDKRKAGSGADPEKNLSRNIDIPLQDLEEVIKISEDTIKVLECIKDVKITNGVMDQATRQISNALQNIKWRGGNFLFTQFNILLKSARADGYAIYDLLINYSDRLTKLNDMITSVAYTQDLKSVPYFLIKDFFKDLENFFEIRKANHIYDRGTDIELASSVMFQSIVEKKNVRVISNDSDIINTIGAAIHVLLSSSPLLRENPNFEFFLENNPQVYTLHEREKGLAQEDVIKRGEDATKYFKGFSIPIRQDKVPDYQRKATDFTFYLERNIKQLDEILRT